jgi:hypothetical protein
MAQKTTVVPDAPASDVWTLLDLPAPVERPADTIKVIGLVWPDDADGHLRVYFSRELDHYVKVALVDVMGTREMEPQDEEFPSRIVYVKETATLQHTYVVPVDKQKEFLNGDLFAGIAPHLTDDGHSVLALSALAKDTIVARPGSVILCSPFFGCSGDCPSRVSRCLCSFNPCNSKAGDCCGSLGTCG